MTVLTKVSLLLLTLMALAFSAVVGLALSFHQKALTREALLKGESIAVNLSLVSAEAILTGDILQLEPLALDATTRHENVVYAAVADAKGKVLAHPDIDAVGQPFRFQAEPSGEDHGLQAAVVDGLGMGQQVWDVSVPVRPKGKADVLGSVHVGINKKAVAASVRKSLQALALVSALCLAGAFVVIFFAIRLLVQPLKRLSAASVKVGRGDLNVRLAVRSRDEFGQVAENFNRMVQDLALAEERKAEAQRIASELQLAHNIQKGLLPQQPPKARGLELAAFLEPAKELGGDYYDWFQLEGGKKVGMVIADVSGKGVPAALHIANLRNLFRFITASTLSPAEVLRQVNAMVLPDMNEEAFVTLIYLVLDPSTGDLTWANAGHDPGLRTNPGKAEVGELGSTGLPLGLMDADTYDGVIKEKSLRLDKGDLVLMYTDGITEAVDEAKEQFGHQRIPDLIRGLSPQAAIERCRQALKAHTGGREQHDDVTLLAFSYSPTA